MTFERASGSPRGGKFWRWTRLLMAKEVDACFTSVSSVSILSPSSSIARFWNSEPSNQLHKHNHRRYSLHISFFDWRNCWEEVDDTSHQKNWTLQTPIRLKCYRRYRCLHQFSRYPPLRFLECEDAERLLQNYRRGHWLRRKFPPYHRLEQFIHHLPSAVSNYFISNSPRASCAT